MGDAFAHSIAVKSVPSAEKMVVSVFQNTKGIFLVDYLEKGKIITEEYYASLLDRLKTIIVERRLGLFKKRVLFFHDNALVHSSRVAQQKLTGMLFELFPHPAYSPDRAPSHFHLFWKLETFLTGQNFVCNEETIQVFNYYFEGLKKNHFRHRIGTWKNVRPSALNFTEIMVCRKIRFDAKLRLLSLRSSQVTYRNSLVKTRLSGKGGVDFKQTEG